MIVANDPALVAPILEARGVHKSFFGVEVLHGVDFTLGRAQVHGLVGQNGAGKSTLVKILNGVYARDAGEILINGQLVHYSSPREASALGIAMVFQELSLIPTMTVTQNILLTREPHGRGRLIDDAAAKRRTRDVMDQLGAVIDPDATVGDLPIGMRQLVEIAKAISQDARILILDEPTASLPATEVDTLFAAVQRLTAQGIAIIYISHHLQEVLQICDYVTVLRDGDVTMAAPTATLSIGAMITSMLGHNLERELVWQGRDQDAHAKPLLRVHDLTTSRIHNVTFDLHPGEIVGIAGLLGSGRTELLRILFGIDKPDSGSIELAGRMVAFGSPSDALRAGIALVPEDRRRTGFIGDHGVRTNILMGTWDRISRFGFVRDRIGRLIAEGFVDRLRIRTPNLEQQVARLSGGNQQKVVVAKNLAIRPKVLLLDDPTVGIDVRSKADILDEARTLAGEGNAIILVSSELSELSALCDRVMVLREGTITGWLDRHRGDDISEAALAHTIQVAS